MEDATIEERRDELHSLLAAMRENPQRVQIEEGQRFAAIQRSIAEHHGEGCAHTGYPVAARP